MKKSSKKSASVSHEKGEIKKTGAMIKTLKGMEKEDKARIKKLKRKGC